MIKKHFKASSILTTEIRTAIFQDREHIVVPLIAIVEGVVHASNSENPELVLASELAIAPGGWNGRPVIGDHYKDRQGPASVNDPKVLEETSFGVIFNTKLEEKKLKMEAWLDPKRAEKVGTEAVEILARVRAHEMIEVSVGAFVTSEEKKGMYSGKSYNGIWRNIVPDHLALLPEGLEGACNIEMGCGAPRASKENTMDKQGSFVDRLKRLMGLKSNLETAEDTSDSDLRNMLDQALYAEEPGYLGINDVFPDDNLVVYMVAPEDKYMTFRRGYSQSKNGDVKLKDDREEVRMITRYEPVTAQQGGQCTTCGVTTLQSSKEDKKMEDKEKAERVKALIECPKTPWVKEDQSYLEALSDDRLNVFEAEVKEPKETVTVEETETKTVEGTETKTVEGTETPVVEPKTIEAWMAEAPEEIREIVASARATEAKKKTNLIVGIRAATKDIYTDKELDAMNIAELEKLSRFAKVPETPKDYSGQGASRTDESTVPSAPKLVDKLPTAS